MYKYILCLLVAVCCLGYTTQAQLVGKFVERQLEKRLPDMIENAKGLEDLSIDKINIKRKAVKLKGSFDVKFSKNSTTKESVRFKAKVSRGKLRLDCLKINLPGMQILGIKIYKRVVPLK